MNANPSYNWLARNTTGISAIEPSGAPVASPEPIQLLRIQERNYTEMPVYLVLLTGWFKVFGFGLLSLRSFTIVCGLAVLLVWCLIVHKLTVDLRLTILSGILLAIDYGFAMRVSEGRMDATSAAFAFGGIAAYLYLREDHFPLAILVSQTLVVLSGLTHPNGGVLGFCGLLFLTLYYDSRRIRLVHVMIAIAPYLLGAAAWSIYIFQDVEAFRAQLTANARFGGRLQTFSAPLENLRNEIFYRYMGALGGWSAGSSAIQKIRILVPLAYAASLAGVLMTPALRARTSYRILVMLTGVYSLVLAFIDGRKSQCYSIHIIPLYTTLVAICALWLWQGKMALRFPAGAAVVGLALINLGGIAYQSRQNPYRRVYLLAIRYLQANTHSDQLIMGPVSLGIGLRFPDNLLDDIRLGMQSRRVPDWIVIDQWYQGAFNSMKFLEPDAYRFVTQLIATYSPVYRNDTITILARRPQIPHLAQPY